MEPIRWPLVWVLWGKPLYAGPPHWHCHVGTCSHGQRWQVRLCSGSGRFVAVVVRKKIFQRGPLFHV